RGIVVRSEGPAHGAVEHLASERVAEDLDRAGLLLGLEGCLTRLELRPNVERDRLERLLGARDVEHLADQRLALALDGSYLRRLIRVGDDALIVHPAVRLGLDN